jgi:hypothetical protein
MTFEEWGEVLRIAANIWPQNRSFFDDPRDAARTPTRTWWAALCRFEADDAVAAMGRLGMTSRYWPSPAELVEATREVLADRMERLRRTEQLGRALLAAPRQGTAAERDGSKQRSVVDQLSGSSRPAETAPPPAGSPTQKRACCDRRGSAAG